MFKYIKISLFLLLSATLLIGGRVGYKWAGGSGATKISAMINVVEGQVKIDHDSKESTAIAKSKISRGEIIKTGPDSRILIDLGGNLIGLDERTDLTLEKLDPGSLRLKLSRGRIMMKTIQPLDVATNFTESRIAEGLASIINYDFKETVSVIPFEKPVTLYLDSQEVNVDQPVEVKETKPVMITQMEFDQNSSSASDFYGWFDTLIANP